jgi:LCP family protein required for cell wall assembly
MECGEARALIDRGVRSGSAEPQQARLRAHLGLCATCRSYQEQVDLRLLDALLGADEPLAPALRRRARRQLHPALLLLGSALLLTLGFLFGNLAFSVFAIYTSAQAMQLPEAEAALPIFGASATPIRSTMTPAIVIPTPVASTPTVVLPQLAEGVTTILILGVDERPGENYPSRTDAIAVVRLDSTQQRVALLSLPRDLIVNIPTFGYDRINAANVYGELNGYPGGGIELTRATVESLLGITIDHVVRVNFQGFIGAIDAIGGVTIDVEQEIYDAQYPTMDYGYQEVYFAPGPQAMDGATALIYGRVRHSDSDFERMKRQQTIAVAALDRVRTLGPLEQVSSLADVMTALRGYVLTDLSEEHMASLAWTYRNLSPSAVERYTLDANMVSIGAPGDPYAQFPLPGMISQLVRQFVGGDRR